MRARRLFHAPGRAAWLVALAAVALPARLRAQTAGDDAATREQARVHFERGVALGDAGRWREAVRELEDARAIRATPSVHYDLGLGYRALGRPRDALASFERYLAEAPPNAPRDLVAQVQGYVRALTAAMASVTVHVAPSDATVTLDGAPFASLDGTLRVEPGAHTLAARAPGYRDTTRILDAHAGERFAFDLSLVPVDAASRLVVAANVRTAAIEIDGATVSYGTAQEYVRPGTHRVRVRAAGYASFERAITALAGTRADVRVTLERPRGLLASPWFWLATTAGAALAVTGIVALASGPLPPFMGPLPNVTAAATGGAR